MKRLTFSLVFSHFKPLAAPLLLALLLTSGCSDDSKDVTPASPDGELKYTYNGTAFTADPGSVSAVYSASDSSITINGVVGQEHGVGLGLRNVKITGAGVYQLRRGSVLNRFASGIFRMPVSGTANTWNTLYAPAATNGTVTVSQLDMAAGKLVGTFSFTAGAIPNTGTTGTRSVTSGSFNITRIR